MLSLFIHIFIINNVVYILFYLLLITVRLTLAQRLRRWTNVNPTLRLVPAGIALYVIKLMIALPC